MDFIRSLENSKHQGQEVYKVFCQNCHAPHPLIPVGAPRKGFSKDWEKRLSKGQKILLKHTIEGQGIMPARGGCFECSDKHLKEAIAYLLE